MNPERLFAIMNLVAMVGWILLAVAPRRRWARTSSGIVVPLLLSGVYVALVARAWGASEGSFATLAGVAALFDNPWLLLAGWTHYLAFDLLIGNWEVRDATDRGVPHLLVVPCLGLTFFFGPAGWLLYMLIRQARSTAAP
jgi:hypothetical protein